MNLISLVMDFNFGSHWCSVLLRGGLVILSAHFLWGTYDNTDEVMRGIAEVLQKYRSKYRHLALVAGFDANTSFYIKKA
mgnify:CR=1 FL=1